MSKNYIPHNNLVSTDSVVETTHGRISLREFSGPGVPVVMIHANSLCKEAFVRQWHAFSGRLRMIAIDLPGHGTSSDAIDPARTYSFSGYADAIVEVLDHLGVEETVLLGHSLGGHVALDLLGRLGGLAGVMIFGTPPIPPGPEGAVVGFRPNPDMAYTGEIEITDAQVASVVAMALGHDADTEDLFFARTVRRTDGRARQFMFDAALAGTQIDQRALVATCPAPLAIVNGADDPVVNLDYIDSLACRNLWRDRPIRILGAGHGPHWQAPNEFNALFNSFVADLGVCGVGQR